MQFKQLYKQWKGEFLCCDINDRCILRGSFKYFCRMRRSVRDSWACKPSGSLLLFPVLDEVQSENNYPLGLPSFQVLQITLVLQQEKNVSQNHNGNKRSILIIGKIVCSLCKCLYWRPVFLKYLLVYNQLMGLINLGIKKKQKPSNFETKC